MLRYLEAAMRNLLLSLFFVLLGCEQSQIDAHQSKAQSDDDLHTPGLVEEPWVDETFMDAQTVEAWRANIATAIEIDAAVPHPREIWHYASDFHIDHSRPDPLLGDPTIWDASSAAESGYHDLVTTDTPTPRADEALVLEAQDKEWAAAEIWIALNRLEDAKRCGKALEEEGEWKVAAMVAVHTGDLVALDRATEKLVVADQVGRAQDIASYAFHEGKVDVAKHIAKTHDWRIVEILTSFQIRRLALEGDSSILYELLDREIAAWESGEFWTLEKYPSPATIVADIAILGQTDKVKAREYAGRYLRLPHANVFIWDHCAEGCYLQPVRGSLELYQLVKSDAVLRELYFSHIRQWFVDTFPAEGEDSGDPVTLGAPEFLRGFGLDMWGRDGGYKPSNLLFTYLWQVRQSGDAELKAFWIKMIDALPTAVSDDGSFAFEREFGRSVLGLPFDASNTNLNGGEQIALATLQGRPTPDMSGVWTMWGTTAPVEYEVDQMNWLFQFLVRGSISSVREQEIMAELEIEPIEEFSFQSQLINRFGYALDTHYGTNYKVEDRMKSAGEIMRLNRRTQAERVDLGLPPIDLYPDTEAELTELLAPSLALLCDQLPARCSRWRPEPASVTTTP